MCTARCPAAAARRREYIDKYKGAFDGYEAYREWVLPRGICRGHRSDRHDPCPTYADRPRVGRAERCREGDVLPHGRGVRRLLGVRRRSDASSTTSRSRAARTTIIMYCAEATGEGSPNGSNEQDLRRLPQLRRQPAARRQADTYNSGGRWRSRRPTGCSSATSRAASAIRRHLAAGIAGGSVTVTTRPTSCPRSSSVRRSRCPSYNGVETPRGLDGIRVFGDAADSSDRKRRDARQPPCSGTTGRRSRCTARWPALPGSTTTRGSSSTPMSIVPRRARPPPPSPVEELQEPSGSQRRRPTTCCRSTTCSHPRLPEGLRDLRRDGVPQAGTGAATSTTPARRRGCSRRTCTTCRKQGARRGRPSHDRRHHLRARLPIRRPSAVRQARCTYAYNFLGIPPEDRIQAPAPTSGRHIIGVEFTKERMGEFREGIGPLKLYIDDQQVAEQEIRTVMGHFSLCGKAFASATTRRMPSRACTRARDSNSRTARS